MPPTETRTSAIADTRAQPAQDLERPARDRRARHAGRLARPRAARERSGPRSVVVLIAMRPSRPRRSGEVGDRVDLLVAQVGRDLHEQRHAQPEPTELLLHAVDERLERLRRLQRPQPRRVRRAHVEHEVVRERRDAADASRGSRPRRPRRARPSTCRRSPRRSCSAAAASRAATASAPRVGEAHPVQERARLAGSARCAGRSLPGCRCAVTVPISTKPNPIAPSPSNHVASLSTPAATPSGLGEDRGRAPRRAAPDRARRAAVAARGRERDPSSAAARPWARSGSIRARTRRKRRR